MTLDNDEQIAFYRNQLGRNISLVKYMHGVF